MRIFFVSALPGTGVSAVAEAVVAVAVVQRMGDLGSATLFAVDQCMSKGICKA